MINQIIEGIDFTLPFIERFWTIVFYIAITITTCIVSYNLNKELHRNIFSDIDKGVEE
jgi:hypothetical protein|tara:strand:- start:17 stop:190 length:174 start_codon:yes stop_codon:yes gene_type:complete